ncbi:MAG: FAD-binding oxidoreductase [Alphaproteobacteria bacterium]|nr:FAD-binding oxidoreductase [Alphaproteobacteria bacterium]
MANIKREHLSGWGLTPATHCVSYRPEKERELARLLKSQQAQVIARGLGRSYGDASLQPHGVIKTERLDNFIEWNAESGILRAQAGVSLAEVMAFSVPRGFLPPVIPGTKYVTLGGALACNVHGKNQYKAGEFAEHVTSLRLLMEGGKSVECSPGEHSDLFWATAGGMGMTGIIEELSLKLMPIHSTSLRTHAERVDNIEQMVTAFEQNRASADYMIGWIDHMARGERIGRGVFEAASHITMGEGGSPCTGYRMEKPRLSVPCYAPSFLLNKYVMAAYNHLRFKRYEHHPANGRTDLNHFFHPLDAIGHWNRLYGKGGFFQYQCLLPEGEQVGAQLRQLLTSLQEEKIFSFLAVIKYHRAGKAPLSFSQAGYSVALDFPNTARVRTAIPHINHWIAERGGRVYLAKDALMSADMFEAMYGKHAGLWRDLIAEADPHGRFSSMMSERLEWKTPQ